jgi:hypothetical protein
MTHSADRAVHRPIATRGGNARAVAMSGVLSRAAGLLVAPAAAEPRVAVGLPPAVRAVVLGSRGDVLPLAAALALSSRAADRAAAAVVACWDGAGGEEVRACAASRGAARLASRLAAHDHVAVARGRLVRLTLPLDPADAATAVRRASSIVDGPLVTAFGGARPPDLEALVAEHDLAVVAADPDSPLARAALARLAERGIVATAHPPIRGGIARALSLAGLTAARLDPECLRT